MKIMVFGKELNIIQKNVIKVLKMSLFSLLIEITIQLNYFINNTHNVILAKMD